MSWWEYRVPNTNLSQLLHTINFWQGKVLLLEPGGEHQGVAPHEGQGQPPKQLAGGLPLLRPMTPCQCCSQLLYLGDCPSMEAAQGLHSYRQENKPLKAAGFSSVSNFPLEGFFQRGILAERHISSPSKKICFCCGLGTAWVQLKTNRIMFKVLP